MLLTRESAECFLRGLFLCVIGFQEGYTQLHTRSLCAGITVPDTRLCDDNLQIIEIVEVSQYDFGGEEYPGRPCVYSDSDCGRPLRHDSQLYMDILTHCDGQRTCRGFYISSIPICSGRFGDYLTIIYRCRIDETATTTALARDETTAADRSSVPWSVHTRSFCTGITMPETRLCDDNLPIIEIVEVSQYDFTGDEYPGRPCVYSDSDCGRAIFHGTQLYMDVITHCDGESTCGGFYISGLPICSGRYGDYMTISFRCHRDAIFTRTTATTGIETSPSVHQGTHVLLSTILRQHTSNTERTYATRETTINPPTPNLANLSENQTRNNIGLGVGVAAAFVVGVGAGVASVVVFIRRKRNNQKPIRASPSLGTDGISGSESGADSTRKSGQRLDKANIREGGGTEAGRANDELAYYNVTPTVIPGETAYANVDITTDEQYADPSSLPANVPDTDGQYADLTGEGPGSSEYETLGPELVVHSSEYVALSNRQ